MSELRTRPGTESGPFCGHTYFGPVASRRPPPAPSRSRVIIAPGHRAGHPSVLRTGKERVDCGTKGKGVLDQVTLKQAGGEAGDGQ